MAAGFNKVFDMLKFHESFLLIGFHCITTSSCGTYKFSAIFCLLLPGYTVITAKETEGGNYHDK